jgi:pimeloyl-ACP methyl ester carboxylesterase
MPLVRANGVDLRVDRYRVGPPGARPTVVFIHGLGLSDHAGLALTLGIPLSTGADVVLYALRGHGRSQVVPSGYRLADHVADLVALLDAVGLGHHPVHLVGCSYGGAVATVTAIRHPERVASVVYADGVLPVPGWTRRHIMPWLEQGMDTLASDCTEDDVAALFAGVPRRKLDALARRGRRMLLDTTMFDDVRNEPALDPAEYAGISCPVSAIYGGRSEMLYLADVLIEHVPHATIHVVPGANHGDIYYRTRELGDLLRLAVGLPPRERAGSLVAAPVGEG